MQLTHVMFVTDTENMKIALHTLMGTPRLGTTLIVFLGQFYMRRHYLFLYKCSYSHVINPCHICDGQI